MKHSEVGILGGKLPTGPSGLIRYNTGMKNLWKNLPNGFTVLAPMYGATDTVFRQIVAGIGKPDVMVTEFWCVDQLYSFGSRVIGQLLEYTESERPLIAQIWGTTPELFYNASQLIVDLGFDGVDINMGCPEKSVMKGGACAALISDPSLAAEIIQATKEGVAGSIPVSVKTRIGQKTMVTEEWCGFLLNQELDALTVHGRTAKEMSLVPAHWEEIGKVAALAKQMGKDTKIIGNGDVESLAEVREKVSTYGVDGVMIGRGVFHNPWVFNPGFDPTQVTKADRLALLARHVKLFRDTWGDSKNYAELKRFYKIYVSAFEGASQLRDALMHTSDYDQALAVAAGHTH